MKTVKDPSGKIKRVRDETAFDMVANKGWNFCPKKEWKENVRDGNKKKEEGKSGKPKKDNKSKKKGKKDYKKRAPRTPRNPRNSKPGNKEGKKKGTQGT